MKNLFRIWFIFGGLLSGAYGVSAQGTVSVKAGVEKTKWLIGEQVRLSLEASFPPGEPFSFFSIDTIPHFEIIDKPKIDTVDEAGGGVLLRQELMLTSFDSGHFVIPAFYINGKDSLQTDSIPVDIVFSDFDPKQDYHDIREIIDVNVDKKKPWWLWYAIGGGALLLISLLIGLTRKRKTQLNLSGVELKTDFYAEAMAALDKLNKTKTGPKHFHSGITEIFRWYLMNRKGIASTKQVTDELVLQLRTLNLQHDDYNQLAQALRITDFVKFAKYESTAAEDQFVFDTIKKSIQFIEQGTA